MSISPYIFDNTVFNQTNNSSPTSPSFYFFSIGAIFQTAGDYSTAIATYPGPDSPQALALLTPTRFDFGSQPFSSLSALQTDYPFGIYTVTASDGSQPTSAGSLSYQANYFTNTIPTITNFSSLSQFDTTQPFTVHYNSFAPNPNATVSYTFFSITDATTHQVVFHADFQPSSSTGVTIPANTLVPIHNYTFELDFSDRLDVGGTTQGFDMRTDGSFMAGRPQLLKELAQADQVVYAHNPDLPQQDHNMALPPGWSLLPHIPTGGPIDADGFYAEAYEDPSGNMILSFAGSVLDPFTSSAAHLPAVRPVITDHPCFSSASRNAVSATMEQRLAACRSLLPLPWYNTDGALFSPRPTYPVTSSRS